MSEDRYPVTAKRQTIVNTCSICGCQFVGLRHYYEYKACDNPACRRECRSRASRKTVWAAKKKSKTQERNCLGWCGEKFKPVNDEHFCSACRQRRYQEDNNYFDAWG